MTIEWTQVEKDRLAQLKAGRGNRKGLYKGGGMRKTIITIEQVIEVKRCLTIGMTYRDIATKTKLSEYLIGGVKTGRYDLLLSLEELKRYPARTFKRGIEVKSIKRLQKIHEYFQTHPKCSQVDAVTFIPETKYMIEKYCNNQSKVKS